MFESVAMKKIRLFDKKREEYSEYKLVENAQDGCDELFEALMKMETE